MARPDQTLVLRNVAHPDLSEAHQGHPRRLSAGHRSQNLADDHHHAQTYRPADGHHHGAGDPRNSLDDPRHAQAYRPEDAPRHELDVHQNYDVHHRDDLP